MVFRGRDQEVADMLLAAGLLSAEQIQSFSKQAFEQSRQFAECVLSTDVVCTDQLLESIAAQLDLPRVETFVGDRITAEAMVAILPRQTAMVFGVLLLGEREDAFHLAVADPFDHSIEMDLEHFLQKPIVIYVCDPRWVLREIERIYPPLDMAGVGVNVLPPADGVVGLENSATLINYVDTLLQKSIQDGASDIHFEPFEDCFRIRYRVDGTLQEIPSHADHLGAAMISRIKVMAQLNIAETRIPQDGRFKVHAMGRGVDIRVSTLPTQFGESVVLRILDKVRVNLDLNMLGIPEDVLKALRAAIHSPNGIFLATGPTGSGKTTTLYSALRELNQPGCKLLTVEDPVEYDIEGIVQVQTHASIGLDFARALRAFLRHDPDKILLGEIRDTETAHIAVQASLTGHMVLSSLHTNDASGAVTRFVDMGVEPYLVAASLVAVLAQRLLRRLNLAYCEQYLPSEAELFLLGVSGQSVASGGFWRPSPPNTDGLAYRGRVGLYELITVNDRFREGITKRKSHAELAQLAQGNGMIHLRMDGLRALNAGLTSVQEVLRYT